MTYLLIKFGGLSLYSAGEAASYAFVTSIAQSWMLQNHILRNNGIYGMGLDFDISYIGLSVAILNFGLSSFSSNDIVIPKAQHGECALVKVFRTYM